INDDDNVRTPSTGIPAAEPQRRHFRRVRRRCPRFPGMRRNLIQDFNGVAAPGNQALQAFIAVLNMKMNNRTPAVGQQPQYPGAPRAKRGRPMDHNNNNVRLSYSPANGNDNNNGLESCSLAARLDTCVTCGGVVLVSSRFARRTRISREEGELFGLAGELECSFSERDSMDSYTLATLGTLAFAMLSTLALRNLAVLIWKEGRPAVARLPTASSGGVGP
ncbi:hypothetical protein BaRGS_00011429, partial [Batillaria attramentaria]